MTNVLLRRIFRLGAVAVLLLLGLFAAFGHEAGFAQQTREHILLPFVVGVGDATPLDPTIPRGGACQDGYHLVNKATGTPGITHLDPAGYFDDLTAAGPDTYDDADYACVPNQTVADITCANGTAMVVDGIAVCGCDEGYGGATCERCAQGYDEEGGVCTLVELPELLIAGLADSFIPGETRVLTPTTTVARRFAWSVPTGGGCFAMIGAGCTQTFIGANATFVAPTAVNDIQLIEISIKSLDHEPTGSPPYEWNANSFVMPAEQIPVSGYGDPRLMPIIRHLRTYMQHRCIGAATFGVARDGVILGSWSLGRIEGPAASKDVWDPNCGDPMREVHELADPAWMDLPFLIGSNSKYHTSAVLRWALKTVAQQEGGLNLTDSQILGLRPFDPNNYPPLIPGSNQPFPVPIVPRDVYSVMAGITPYPATPIVDSTAYGVTSTTYALCDGSSVANGFADPQWRNVTIGHIISHQTGLQRSAPFYESDFVPRLAAVRGLTTQQDFIDQEAILRDQWGNAKVGVAKGFLNYPGGTTTYVVPRPTLEEMFHVLAGRCLRYPLGIQSYSNTSPAFSQLIIRQLMANGRFVADLGNPASHHGSALQLFLQQTVGISTSATNGIFPIQGGANVPGYLNPGPRLRDWNETFQLYDYLEWDPKQPHCVWNAGNSTCSFNDWRNPTNDRGRIDWSMNYGMVRFIDTLVDTSPGTGSFMVEARDELRFLANYQIGSYNTPATVGRPRAGQPNGSYSHNGSLRGGYSFARQIAASTGESMSLPPLTPQGGLTDDYLNLANFTCPTQLPDGVDYIVALNQNKDRKCVNQLNTNTSDPNDNLCQQAYSVLDAVMLYGICQVNWAVVPTVINLAPPN